MTGGPEDDPTSGELAERKMRFLFALRSRGVTDTRVLTAMENVDRGLFVRGLFADKAYEDMPLPIACGQTISQPSVVGPDDPGAAGQPARHGAGGRHRLRLPGRDPCRNLPAGSTPSTATAAWCAKRPSFSASSTSPTSPPSPPTVRTACLTRAPFDRILVTAAAEDPPGPLLAQLKPGGIMVLPVGQSDAVQSLIKVTRTKRGFDYEELRPVRFVPLVEGLGSE
jgi:protein-L-isoaspartate(D-aspartate) O-methyltransferase